ncbi:DUF4139 domain-containing protein [Sphingomonas sanxanigenens]|uniref:DUF4139 domain-containing protein n=1 Tax=Sphingomonas sanxanigenens DSM 19645 = NX02 TaxID=1123269 RepID=W0AJR5_9SPHN|nr:DUF4139 domain-containing protein [Sphingomonas sanxanigenens]AHE56817.1 hypothetical protein NX02_26075 [Sphingomonas sanxanigenens DSM 19645 = NX02]
MRKSSFVVAALMFSAAGQAFAQTAVTPPPAPDVVGSAQGDVSVTIYQNGQALVQDVRELSLPAGRTRQEFPDVSAQIRAETVSLAGPGLGIVEQNFDFDLLSPDKLMEKAVGSVVTIVRTNPATGAETREQARVLAANGGIVLQIGNRIEVLRDDGLPVRVVFDKVPENLRARPTLSVTLQVAQAGRIPAALSYLTPGLGWTSDYVMLFDEAKGAIDMQGWVTLSNNTGTSYRNADVLLVAANPNAGGGRRGLGQLGDATIEEAGTETGARERLGDFYLYPLAERTTIANAQQKQVSFLDVKGAPARKAYEWNNRWMGSDTDFRSAATVLKFSTSKQGGLGDQLPQGTIRVYMRDARGDPQFIGESRVDAAPMGSQMAIRTGEAFDVKGTATVVKRERLSSKRWRTEMRYEFSNARADQVTVEAGQDGLWGDVRIVSATLEGQRVSADRMEWKVPVPANGKAGYTVVFDTRY